MHSKVNSGDATAAPDGRWLFRQPGLEETAMKNIHRILVAVATTSACVAAQADVFPKESLIRNDRHDVAGGHGTVYGEYAFTRDKALKDQAIKEVSWLRLMPGDSIGYHPHGTNEGGYIIRSGEGGG